MPFGHSGRLVGRIPFRHTRQECDAGARTAGSTASMLAFIDIESRVRLDHPLRTIKYVADEALADLSSVFDDICAEIGRSSIPPELRLKASLLISLYSVRGEQAFCSWTTTSCSDGFWARPCWSLASIRRRFEESLAAAGARRGHGHAGGAPVLCGSRASRRRARLASATSTSR
jgi:hypothetical protein